MKKLSKDERDKKDMYFVETENEPDKSLDPRVKEDEQETSIHELPSPTDYQPPSASESRQKRERFLKCAHRLATTFREICTSKTFVKEDPFEIICLDQRIFKMYN